RLPLTLKQSAPMTSPGSMTFTAGTPATFTVTTTAFPVPALTHSGDTLPSGVSFDASTGILNGTPAVNTGATYHLVFTAHNGVGSDATQNFILTIDEAPAVTSPDNATFVVGVNRSFTVRASGFPVPALSRTGDPLPGGVTFDPLTGILSGTAAANTGGTYHL